MPFIEDVITVLTDAGVGTYPTTIMATSAAKIPDTLPSGGLVHLHEYGGSAPERTHNRISPPAYQNPALQIKVRGATYSEARTKARAAYNALEGIRNVTIGGTFYRHIKVNQEPFDMGLDNAGRPTVGFNVSATLQP